MSFVYANKKITELDFFLDLIKVDQLDTGITRA